MFELTTLEQVKALEAAGRLDSARAKTMIRIIQTALRVFDRNTTLTLRRRILE